MYVQIEVHPRILVVQRHVVLHFFKLPHKEAQLSLQKAHYILAAVNPCYHQVCPDWTTKCEGGKGEVYATKLE